jgi:hypothetical protein
MAGLTAQHLPGWITLVGVIAGRNQMSQFVTFGWSNPLWWARWLKLRR